MKKDGIGFVDHGIYLHVITPWQPGEFRDLEPPEIKVAVQNFGPVKIMIGSTDAMITKGEPVVGFQVMFNNFIHIASVFACPDRKWVDDVYVETGYGTALMSKAICESIDFPFNRFILRELEGLGHDYDSADSRQLIERYKKGIMHNQSLLRKNADKTPDWRMNNPVSHNENRFRYLVHSLSHGSWAKEFESNDTKQRYLEGYSDDPLQQPDAFVKIPYISCSVIDQNHPTMWGGAGLILGVPVKNIRSAYVGDSHTFVRSNGIDDYDSNLPNAMEILRMTDKDMWNEVVISGVHERTGSSIKIVGGFVCRRPKDDGLSDEKLASRVMEFCGNRNLPVVTIMESESRKTPVPGWMTD